MLDDLKRRMEGSIEALKKEFSGLRTGRASVNLLEPVKVDAYGSMMPLNQVGSVNVPEPRLLTVQVWDEGLVQSVEKAIRDSQLGLNPATEGNVIRVPVPELSEERRRDLSKVAGQYAEQARVSIRNVRKDGMDSVKKQQKDGDISEDEQKRLEKEIQNLTDEYTKKVDEAYKAKEQEIMQV